MNLRKYKSIYADLIGTVETMLCEGKDKHAIALKLIEIAPHECKINYIDRGVYIDWFAQDEPGGLKYTLFNYFGDKSGLRMMCEDITMMCYRLDGGTEVYYTPKLMKLINK